MIVVQQILDALADLDERLLEGAEIDNAVAQSALDNGLISDVLMHRAKSQFGDLEVHRANLRRAAEWRAQDRDEQRAFSVREKHVREEAAHAAESTYYACLLDDPERAGRPSWAYCLEKLSERLELSDYRLRNAARDELFGTLARLDRKHGTRTAHF